MAKTPKNNNTFTSLLIKLSLFKGPFKYPAVTQGGGGVSQMITVDHKGGGGVSQMITDDHSITRGGGQLDHIAKIYTNVTKYCPYSIKRLKWDHMEAKRP